MVGCFEDNEIEPVNDAAVPECTGDESRECVVEGGCLGTQTCTDGAFGECQAPDEICDGIDNNCDGTVDEGFVGLGDPCTAGEGLCADKGTNVCNAAGDDVECNAVAGDGTDEVCDGVDNDCDGQIDNGVQVDEDCDTGRLGACGAGATICEDGDVRCVPAAEPTDEVCDGIDNDCDGRNDEGTLGGPLAEACYDGPEGTEGVGACAAGIQVCTDGMQGACADQVTPTDEICDGIDNDCDGEVDNVDGVECVCVPGQTQTCYGGPEGTEGVGVCQLGIQACNEDGTAFGECEDMVMPGVELCDGRDNDCNGEIDDAVGVGDDCTVGQGLCGAEGTRICDLESGQVVCDAEEGLPEDEICDGVDNDCDGAIDDVPGAGEPCTVGEGACLARGVLVCGKGDAGGLVCNAAPAEPGEEICDGIDNDCNGEVDDAAGVGEACEVGVGLCRSTAVAVCDAAAGAVVCPATAQDAGIEFCATGLDEDCDGETDEEECTAPCADDDECGPGAICEDGGCAPGCRDDDGCGFAELCEDGQCVPGDCREDIECGDGSLCIDSFCVVGDCRGDEDCADGQVCSANSCIDVPAECADPAVIGFGVTVGSNVDAGDDFQGSCNPSSEDVVFRLDPAGYVGTVCATTDGSDYDTKLFARADCAREDTELGCDDDGGIGVDSEIEFEVAADGAGPFVFVDGFSSSTGNFVLTVTEGPCACRGDGDCAEGEACRIGACVAIECGDGVVDGPEQCDDGNAEAGDGCSDICEVEVGYTCDELTGLCQLNGGVFGSVQRLPGEQLPENEIAPGGEPFENECDEGEVIYGAEAALGAGIDRMRALCADFELAGDRLVLDPAPPTAAVGNADAEFGQRIVCPPNHAVSGYVAYAPAGISLLCTPVSLDEGRLTFGQPIESDILGVGLAEVAREACGANAAAGAHAGRADDTAVYSFSLRCDTFTDLCDDSSVCNAIGDCFTDEDCDDGATCTDFFCLDTEICDDGVGNNGNELVDCLDDASCAEHPACADDACETIEDCGGAECVDGACAQPGDAPIAIAYPGNHVATAGELDEADSTWERPGANCVGGGAEGAKFYETRTIVNNTGARQQVTIQTADPDFDGYVHVFASPFDAELTPAGCIVGNDDAFPGSRVSDVDIEPGEELVIVVSTFGDGATGVYTIDVRTQNPTEACDDTFDNDDDGLVDCDDPDCAVDAACAVCGDDIQAENEECDDGNLDAIDGCSPECTIEIEICDNGVDDEGDGAVDCDDPDCDEDRFCFVAEICDDGFGNNGNDATDCLDAACVDDPSCQFEPVAEGQEPQDIAAPGHFVGFTGVMDGDELQWARPSAACVPEAGEDHFYVAWPIVNQTGAPQNLRITGTWADDDGYLHVYREPFEPDELAGCVVGDDDFDVDGDGSGLDGSRIDSIAIADGEVLWIVASTFTAQDVLGQMDIEVLTRPDEVCDDGLDNDDDTLTDCDDADCVADPACLVAEPEICDDLIDNDLDGDTDCADPDCAADPACEVPACVPDEFEGGGSLEPEATLEPGDYAGLTICEPDEPFDSFFVALCPGGTLRATVNHDPLLQSSLVMGFIEDPESQFQQETVLGTTTGELVNDDGYENGVIVVQYPDGGLTYDLTVEVEGCDEPVEICDDLIDNDGDGDADCDDADCAGDPACPVVIAACDAPILIEEPGIYEGTTADGSNDVPASECQGNANGNEVVFQLATPLPSTVCFSATGFDTVLYARSVDCAAGVPAGCNDDGGNLPGFGSQLELTTEAGVDYFIYLDGYQQQGGDYQLEVAPGTCDAPGVELCDNEADDDADGLVDCDDEDCAGDPACAVAEPEICDDLIDNDLDGDTDCDDVDCAADPACIVPAEICDDSVGNNGNDATDCLDAECVDDPSCQFEPAPEGQEPLAIAAPGHFVGFTGGMDGDERQWNRPTAECGNDGGEADHFFIAYPVVNQTGAPQNLRVTGAWSADGYMHIFRDPFDPADLAGCAAASDDFNGLGGSRVDSVDIADGEVLWIVASTFGAGVVIDQMDIEVLTRPDEVCADGLDNDDDTLVDCDDPDCVADPACLVADPEVCDDLIDNDLDGDTDCDDADCAGDPACAPPEPEVCDDLIDNDGDGDVDCDDAECVADPACQVVIAACDAPIEIDGPGLYEGTTAGGSNDVPAAECQADANGNEVVFHLATPVPATVCFSATGFDTVLYARSTDCAAGVPAGCNDDGGGLPGFGSQLELTTEAGVDYFLYLDAYQQQGGDYQLEVAPGTCDAPGVELCDNGADDDADGLVDCDDEDCAGDPACAVAEPEICDDGIDNDLDGDTDCDDADCAGDPACEVVACEIDVEPNEDIASATRIEPGTYDCGEIADADDTDYTGLRVCAGGTITATLSLFVGDFDVYLYDEDGNELDNGFTLNPVETAEFTTDADAAIFVRVDGAGGVSGGYTLDVAVDCPQPEGDLVITEFLQNPRGGDVGREWFEVFNGTGADIDVQGWTIGDDDNDTHLIEAAVTIPAGAYFVFGSSADPLVNGGVPVDYEYDGITLANSTDEIVILDAGGAEVAAARYDNGLTFPDSDGVAAQFDARVEPTVANTADGTNWCEAVTGFGDEGQLGTPGAANDPCGPVIEPPVPIADLSQAIAFDGSIDEGDALWEVPNVDCSARGDGRMYAYDSYRIINETGDPQFLDLTALLPEDGTGDGLLHVFDGEFDPAVLDNCVAGGDNADGGGYRESFIGAVPIDPDQILTVVLTSELPVPDGAPEPIGGPSRPYFGAYTLDIVTAAPNRADFCRLQFPETIEGTSGDAFTVYGRLYEMGFTDRSVRVDRYARVWGQVGYLPDGGDPADEGAWTWIDAEPNRNYNGDDAGEPNNDEYQADVVLPGEGLYSYAFRFTVDSGISYQMCDLDGAGEDDRAGDFSLDQAGVMLVEQSACGQACQDLEDCGFLGQNLPGVPADRAECDQQCADGVITEEQAECIDDALSPPGQCNGLALLACQ